MAATDQVMLRLHKALEAGALPPQGQRIGRRLMSQLHQPTRIAVIGLAGSGKSRLIELLLGADLMPAFGGISAVEIGYGEVARTQFTMADGTINLHEGQAAPSTIPAGVARVSILIPDPRLTGWSFAEINLVAAPKVQIQLIDWVSGRSDIAIWCTGSFDDRERALWSAVPDHLKDHSFLALTRADRLYMKGELATQIARLQPIVAEEFRCLYPVATLQAAAARTGSLVTNDTLWRSSGGMAIVEGIRAQVDQARMADLDHAYMLLERFKVPSAAVEDAQKADAAATVRGEPAPAIRAPAPASPAAAGAQAAAPQPETHDAGAVIQQALGVLRGCADELIASGAPARCETTDRVLERCNATAQDLVRLFSENENASPEHEALREDILEGEQMLMLLRLERGDCAAEDSLTVLLQMKKEMSGRIAR